MFSFYVMTEKGYRVLNDFIEKFSSSDIKYVVSDRDKTLEDDFYVKIKNLCVKENIQFYNRKDNKKLNSNYSFAVSWRYIIREEPNLIVFHDSLLPKYRGFAPVINSLINGEKKVGVTALYANSDYDKGDIIFQESLKLNYPAKIKNVIKDLIPLYIKLMNKIVYSVKKGKSLPRLKQNDEKSSYSLWREEKDFLINWNDSSEKIIRHIDALGNPYKGAATYIKKELLRVLDAKLYNNLKIENRDSGKVIFLEEGCPIVVCGKGLIKINEMKDSHGNSVLPFNKLKIKFSNKAQ